jgi:hypothetical protein
VTTTSFQAEFVWLKDNPQFEQRPASILEFLGPDYLNIEHNVRPILKQILIDIFGTETNPDRIARYEQGIFTGGIGVGKTTLASIIIPYMAHWVLCLKDPQGHFGMMAGTRIAFMQMSTSETQAKEVVFGDIKARIDNSPWFKKNYPYDKAFKNQFRFPKDVWIIPGDSAETTFEGYNILGGILDEADSHKITKNKDYADQGYTTIHGRITSRFQDRGFLLIVGQMKKASGFAAKMYRKMRQDPKAYTSLITIWESMGWEKFLNPDGSRASFWYDTQRYVFTTKDLAALQGFPSHIIEVPLVYERDFLNSPQKALRDLAGRPPEVNSPLFHDPSKIDLCRTAYIERYGNFVPVDANNNFHDGLRAQNSVPRVGHIDIAFSPDGDALGLAIAHVAEMVTYDDERKPFIIFDLVMRIQAPPGRELYLGDIRQLIYQLKYDRKFNITKITTDGFQCIVGDMIIPTLDGQNRTIAELAQSHPKGGFWTYSYSHATGRIVPGRCVKAWKTGTKPVLEVLLDNGEVVKTTCDHRFMMRDGSYREARDLRPGDSLMPLYRDVTPDDWKGLQGYERVMQPGRKSGGRWQYTHRMVAPPLRKGEIVHHKDFGKRNNAPENLEVMTIHDHRVLHAKAIWEQPGHREKMSRVVSESNKRRTGLDARRRRRDVTIEMLEPFRGYSWRIPAKELGVSQDLIYSRVREAGFNGWNDFSYGEINGRCVPEPVTYRRRDRSNHKVVSVTDCGETEDVYDLSIDEHHNFAIGAGVFIHNSTDMRQQLQRRRIMTEVLSADRTTLPFFDLHDAVVEGRVAIPPYMVPTSPADPTLMDIVYKELSQLQDEGSKIDHPPDGSKDVADAIACVVSSIMGDPRFHRRMSSVNPMGSQEGVDGASNGRMSPSSHPAFVGGTPRAPIAPRVDTDPIQWRPPTRRM